MQNKMAMKPEAPTERGPNVAADIRCYLKYSHLPLVLYGAGGTAEKLRGYYFNYASISIDAICDGDAAKHGQTFHNLVILSPEELVRKYPDANILIAVLNKYHDEVYSRLRSLGVRPDRIFRWGQAAGHAPFPLTEFSVCPWRDLFRFRNRFADDESRELFRSRYRHWLLADRPENPSPGEKNLPEREDILVYHDAGELCADLDWQGEKLAAQNILLEFDNGDRLVPRAMFTLAALKPEASFLLREGSARVKTWFWFLNKDSGHAV